MALRTVGEAAKVLSVATSTVYTLCRQHKLPHYRIGTGRGAIRISDEQIQAYVSQAAVEPDLAHDAEAAPKEELKHIKLSR